MLVLDWPVLSERRDSFPPRPSFLSRFSVLKKSRDRSGARRVEERGDEGMGCEARGVWGGVRLGVRVGCNGRQWEEHMRSMVATSPHRSTPSRNTISTSPRFTPCEHHTRRPAATIGVASPHRPYSPPSAPPRPPPPPTACSPPDHPASKPIIIPNHERKPSPAPKGSRTSSGPSGLATNIRLSTPVYPRHWSSTPARRRPGHLCSCRRGCHWSEECHYHCRR